MPAATILAAWTKTGFPTITIVHGSTKFDLWPSFNHRGSIYVSPTLPGPGGPMPIPDWMMAAWHDRRPVEPLLDYLLDHDLAPPALAEAIRAAYAA